MQAKVIVNGGPEFNLTRWNASDFNTNTTLYIQTADLTAVRDAFNSISNIAIVVDGLTMAQYVMFDSYSQISFLNKVYSEDMGTFVDTMSVTLQKTDLASQVQRLDDQINNVVDPETLTLEELRSYKLKKISEACTEDIYSGETVELSDGTRQHFRYNVHDQLNLISLFSLAIAAPEMERYPYHGDASSCAFYSRVDVVKIVAALLLKKTQLTTYCNQLTLYVRTLTTREEIMAAEYGMELPEEYQAVITEIMSGTIEQLQAFIDRIIPHGENN